MCILVYEIYLYMFILTYVLYGKKGPSSNGGTECNFNANVKYYIQINNNISLPYIHLLYLDL